MWEEMARCAAAVAAGEAPAQQWVRCMEVTQRTVNAVMRSLDADCAVVQLCAT